MNEPPIGPTPAPPPPVSELAVAEIERRLQWRAMPALMFLGILGLLLLAAFWPQLFPPRHVTGLPDDPDVFAAAQLLRGHAVLPGGGLRFESALTGDVAPGAPSPADLDDRIAHADRLVEGARGRLRRDIRLHVVRGALDLMRHRYDRAERHYWYALDRYGDYPEARLGLGVTLAMAGDIDRSHLGGRQQYLRAIAQFAAVQPADAEYDEALYDRALLLERVGRRREAAAVAREYLARPGAAGDGAIRRVAAGVE